MYKALKYSIFIIIPFALSTPAYSAEHIVYANAGKATEMRFAPQDIEIKAGDTVTWINNADMYHNVKALKKDIPADAEPFTSKGLAKKDDRWSHTFSISGKYNYFCVPHRSMGMIGSVTVSNK